MFMPFVVNADTWLDKEEYRDLSWFDKNTYDSTTEYIINNEKKLAGLVYLVNKEGYTFENKTIKIAGSCNPPNSGTCAIDMTSHEWVPFKNTFLGMIDFGNRNYIYIQTLNEKATFFSDGFCSNSKNYMYMSGNQYCNIFAESKFDIHVKESDKGTLEIPTTNSHGNSPLSTGNYILFTPLPNDGYYFSNVYVYDKAGNNINVRRVDKVDDNRYMFYAPEDEVYVEPEFSKIGEGACTVIKGNGKRLGDEIKCGTEYFYVLSNKNGYIRMIAKYNLNVGVSIYKEKLSDNQTCSELATIRHGQVKSDAFYSDPGYCFYTKLLPDAFIVQNENAKSAHWDENLNYLYPQIGDVYMIFYGNSNNEANPHTNFINDSDSYFSDFDIIFRDNYYDFENNSSIGFSRHLLQYKNTINNISGLNVQNIGLLPISELDDIIASISNKRLPLKDWGDGVRATLNSPYVDEVHFGDLKPYIPKEYSWLYSTTYWNSTKYNYGDMFVFTAEQGKLCGAGFAYCAPTTKLGCGIRPVLEIYESDLRYLIKKETDGNGTIEVVDSALGNDTIHFKTTSKKGYKLKSIVIMTDSGKIIEFEKGDIIKNSDGTISIDKNKFTMPFENIIVQAKWVPDSIVNIPDTLKNLGIGDKVCIISLILILNIGIGIFIYKKKNLDR